MASHHEEKCSSRVNENKIQNGSESGEKQVVFTEQRQFHDQQQPSTNAHTAEGNHEKLDLELFKYKNGGEQYILKVHELSSGIVNKYNVKLENGGAEKWRVGMSKLDKKAKPSVDLMKEEVDRPIFHKKSNLTLLERLNGWTLEKRKRKKGLVDKFYYHQKRQFRSLVEVAGFLLYSGKPKDLKPLPTLANVPEPLEEEAATALILLSNGEA